MANKRKAIAAPDAVEVSGTVQKLVTRVVNQASGKKWTALNGDCMEILPGIPDNSVDYWIFSPAFASLYTYSNSERDMGNCRSYEEFCDHYRFFARELYRILKPGRLLSFHCMLLPASKQFDGFIGLKDFRGDLIRLHQEAGMIYHSEVVIWKDPVTAMQRTKAKGLLHKEVCKDSTASRQGIPDYLITMRKPGVNAVPVSGPLDYYVGDQSDEDFTRWCRTKYETQSIDTDRPMDFKTFKSIQIWQRYASPVWMDINPSNTLQRKSAREEKDERHICPLQLQVIQRGLQLWTMPGDVVGSPCAGIGSEGFVAVGMDRRALLVELKESYFRQLCLNLQRAESEVKQAELSFGGDESGPRSEEWLARLGAEDAIKEEAMEAGED
jgi:hypothetical protein